MSNWLERMPGFRTAAELRKARAELTALRAELEAATAARARTQADLERRQAQLTRMKAWRVPVPTARRMKSVLKEQGEQYRTAQPFPHIVLDNFIDATLLREVVKEFEAMSRDTWHHTSKPRERKSSIENLAEFGPQTRLLIYQLNMDPFLTFLERLTGIPGLISDPHLRGGGLHEIRRGGVLGVHADFNFHQRLGLYRRLNLLIYLNEPWQDEWGGHLELWDRENTRCVERVAPLFNRTVIFDTSNYSYHGHPTPLDCPEDRARRSIALYYYSATYPFEEDLAPHGTVFVDGAASAGSHAS